MLSIVIVCVFPFKSNVVNAETEEALKGERSALQSELNEKRKNLEKIQTELVELEEEIDIVNEVIEANEAEITKTEDVIEESEAEIRDLEEKIEHLQDNIERRHELLKDRASALQKNGGTISYIDVLFGAQDFTDFIDRISLVTRITQSDKDLLEQLYIDQETVEEQKELVDEKLEELEATKAELEHIQELTLDQKEELEVNQKKLEKKKKKSEKLIKELEIEDNELEQMIEEARRAVEEQNIVQYSSETSNETSKLNTNTQGTKVASGNVNTIINAGNRYKGNSRYKFGGGRSQSDIAKGLFDCSGFVSWAFSQGGVSVPASTGGLSGTGTKVSTSEMQPGDIVFFDTYKTNGHVGIYLGNGKFLGSQSSTGVAVADMTSGYWGNKFNGHVRRIVK
nr:C40 family peptidase [Amphibacillus sp. MSJ-3]